MTTIRHYRQPVRAMAGTLGKPIGVGLVVLLLACTASGCCCAWTNKGDQPKTGGAGIGDPTQAGKKDDVKEPVARLTAELGKDGDARKIDKVFLSRDGRRMAITNGPSPSSKAQIWDISAGPKKLHELEGRIEAISPDGKKVIQAKKDGRFLVNADAGTSIAPIGPTGFVFFQSNSTVWTVNLFLGAKSQKKLAVVSYDPAGKKGKELEFDNKSDRFAGANEKGEVFFVSTSDVQVWDASAEKWTRKLTLKPDAGETILLDVPFAVSPDGKWLMANAGKGTFDPAIFDLSTGTGTKIPKQVFHPHNPVFVPERDLLMGSKSAGTKKYQAVAFDAKANAIVATYGTVESISTLAVSADGSRLAAGTWEGEVAIWDLR